MRILITGAGGMVAQDLSQLVEAQGHAVRMSDRVPVEVSQEFVRAELEDPDEVAAALAGMDAIVHLGAVTWDYDVLETMIPANVAGPWNIFSQAQLSGVKRVIFASTHHTVGYHHLDLVPEITEEFEPRPDTFYAVTKLYGEHLARYFHDKFGMRAHCLRIGYYMSPSRVAEGLDRSKEALLLSARDFAQIVSLCLSDEAPAFGIYNCISNARRPWVSIAKARAELGYSPVDTVESIFGDVPDQEELTRDDFGHLDGPFPPVGKP